MKTIVISGVDGCGKSTQLERLTEHLTAQGHKVFAFHAVQFSIVNKIARLIQPVPKDKPQKRAVTTASWLTVQVRKIALFVDLFFFRVLRKMLVREDYDYIVSDRYFYDTVVNIMYLSRTRFSVLLPLIEWIIPVPDIKLFLSVPPEEIMQRARVPEQGLPYLQKKSKIFQEKIEDWHYTTVDGSGSTEETFEKIKTAAGM